MGLAGGVAGAKGGDIERRTRALRPTHVPRTHWGGACIARAARAASGEASMGGVRTFVAHIRGQVKTCTCRVYAFLSPLMCIDSEP